MVSPAGNEATVREDEIVAEWWLDRDHWPEGQAIRRLARAVVQREAALRTQAETAEALKESEAEWQRRGDRAIAAEAERDKAVRAAEHAQAALRAADEAFQWIAKNHPKVLRELPTDLYRNLRSRAALTGREGA